MSDHDTRQAVVLVVIANGLLYFAGAATNNLMLQEVAAYFPPATPSTGGALALYNAYGAPLLILAGAVALGLAADRVGRASAIAAALLLAGLGVLGLAVAPSYASAGPLATASYFVCRSLVNFGYAGALGSTVVYLLESAPPGRGALHVAFLEVSAVCGGAAVQFVGSLLMAHRGFAAFDAGGWRVLLWIAAALVPLAWLVWRAAAAAPRFEPAPPAAGRQSWLVVMAIGVVALAGAAMGDRLQAFMTFSTAQTLYRDPQVAVWMLMMIPACGSGASLAGGVLADRYGRRLLIRIPAALLLVSFVPLILLAKQDATPTVYLAVSAVLLILGDLFRPALFTTLAEAMPPRHRALGLGATRALALAAPLLIIGRITNGSVTNGDLMNDGLVAVAGIAVLFALRETAPAAPSAKTIATDVFT